VFVVAEALRTVSFLQTPVPRQLSSGIDQGRDFICDFRAVPALSGPVPLFLVPWPGNQPSWNPRGRFVVPRAPCRSLCRRRGCS
jgi:hypothetical protein